MVKATLTVLGQISAVAFLALSLRFSRQVHMASGLLDARMKPFDWDAMFQLAAESEALVEDIQEAGHRYMNTSASLRSVYRQAQAELVRQQATAESGAANTECQAPQPKAPAQVFRCFAVPFCY